jgi:tRNA threonylcarbamoyladenosine biosynthesis protein TsaB
LKILGIETSSPRFSLCLVEDERLIIEVKKDRQYDKTSRDGRFFSEAQGIIEAAEPENIGAIAVCIGPGQFTSLRVGVSLAKGMAHARKIPVVGVNTLDVMGAVSGYFDLPVCATINAYHKELYAAFYEHGEKKSEYHLFKPAELRAYVKDKTIIIGSGIAVIKDFRLFDDRFIFIEDDLYYADAYGVVKVARSRIHAQAFDDAQTIEPFYIKKTDAERNYDKTDAVQ